MDSHGCRGLAWLVRIAIVGGHEAGRNAAVLRHVGDARRPESCSAPHLESSVPGNADWPAMHQCTASASLASVPRALACRHEPVLRFVSRDAPLRLLRPRRTAYGAWGSALAPSAHKTPDASLAEAI